MDINATVEAVKILDTARYSIENRAITGLLYRAAERLNKELREYLTGDRN